MKTKWLPSQQIITSKRFPIGEDSFTPIFRKKRTRNEEAASKRLSPEWTADECKLLSTKNGRTRESNRL